MTPTKAITIIGIVLAFHGLGLLFDLYFYWPWYDVPMHFSGGLAMGALGLAIWNEGVHEVKLKGRFKKHLEWWLVPLFVIGFVSFIGIGWELHEFLLDKLLGEQMNALYSMMRQPGLEDTMADFAFDLLGGITAIAIFYRGYGKRNVA